MQSVGGVKLRTMGKKERPPEPNAWVKALVPLNLYPKGDWDPAEEYWGESGEPIEAWAKPIIKRGLRPMYEMEQVVPGADPGDFDSEEAEALFMRLLWMSPSDNLGIRVLLPQVRARNPWTADSR
jgi:hypothetical protein